MKNYYSLQGLREVIPEFDRLCENYLLVWILKMSQRKVTRMGYPKMDFFGEKYNDLFIKKEIHGQLVYFFPDDMPFSDGDHVFGLQNAVIDFAEFFGPFIPRLYYFQPDYLRLLNEVGVHEVGETKIGDWTDDKGHDDGLKDRLELETFEQDFLRLYPTWARSAKRRQFLATPKGGIAKMFDKMAFIDGITYYKSCGVTGSLEHKLGMTEADKESVEITGSTRPIDNIYAHLLRNFKETQPLLPFFMGVTEAAYRLFFNEFDPNVRGCVPGEVPPGVKQFY